MIINLSGIMSGKEQVKNIQAPFELESINFNNVEYKLVKSSPVNVTISRTGEREARVFGDTKVTIIIPCNKCLSDVEVEFDVSIDREFNFASQDQEEINELKEANYLNEYDLDLDLLIREEIILDFPMRVLCNEDCKGLCSSCGTNLNKGSCNCEDTSLDPRMAAIQDVFNEFKEV